MCVCVCVTVCASDCHFCVKGGLSKASASACLFGVTFSAQLIRYVWTLPHCDVIGVSYCDILMMQPILVDDTYIKLKWVMWVSCSNDVGGFR